MMARTSPSPTAASTPQMVDALIKDLGGWRAKALSQLRASIRHADPAVVEAVKWRKPSNPVGVPVWSHDGIICFGNSLKNAVRLTFPKGALMKDPQQLFNARLDSNMVRAIDFAEGGAVDEAGLEALIVEAMRLNTSKVRTR